MSGQLGGFDFIPAKDFLCKDCGFQIEAGKKIEVPPSGDLCPSCVQLLSTPGSLVANEPCPVNHPKHYGGASDPYEAIKVIEAWNLGFCLGNTVKYISRAGKKNPAKTLEDLEKARWYLDREIKNCTDKK